MATTLKQLFEESAKRGKEAFRETLASLTWDMVQSMTPPESEKRGRTIGEALWDGLHAADPEQFPAADPVRRKAALLARKARLERIIAEGCARHEALTDS